MSFHQGDSDMLLNLASKSPTPSPPSSLPPATSHIQVTFLQVDENATLLTAARPAAAVEEKPSFSSSPTPTNQVGPPITIHQPHTNWLALKSHTAKCDRCNVHNDTGMMYRCADCSLQICSSCKVDHLSLWDGQHVFPEVERELAIWQRGKVRECKVFKGVVVSGDEGFETTVASRLEIEKGRRKRASKSKGKRKVKKTVENNGEGKKKKAPKRKPAAATVAAVEEKKEKEEEGEEAAAKRPRRSQRTAAKRTALPLFDHQSSINSSEETLEETVRKQIQTEKRIQTGTQMDPVTVTGTKTETETETVPYSRSYVPAEVCADRINTQTTEKNQEYSEKLSGPNQHQNQKHATPPPSLPRPATDDTSNSSTTSTSATSMSSPPTITLTSPTPPPEDHAHHNPNVPWIQNDWHGLLLLTSAAETLDPELFPSSSSEPIIADNRRRLLPPYQHEQSEMGQHGAMQQTRLWNMLLVYYKNLGMFVNGGGERDGGGKLTEGTQKVLSFAADAILENPEERNQNSGPVGAGVPAANQHGQQGQGQPHMPQQRRPREECNNTNLVVEGCGDHGASKDTAGIKEEEEADDIDKENDRLLLSILNSRRQTGRYDQWMHRNLNVRN